VKAQLPDLDVVVIGAGPAGCECARNLALAGHRVLVAEEHLRPGEPVHCTGIISAQAYRAFDLPEAAIQSQLGVAELISPGGVTLRVDLNGTGAYSVDRREVDRWLAGQAAAAGAEFHYGTRASEVSIDRAGVSLSGQREGEPWSARARAVVFATGAKSVLPGQAGLAKVRSVMAGAQAEIPVVSPPEMHVWLGHDLAPGGFGWAVPGRPGWSRVGVLTREKPSQALAGVARRAFGPEAEEMLAGAIHFHPVPAAPRCPSFGDRALSVGDAAGQVKMTTGGGVYYGLLASRIASEVLSDALTQGRLTAPHLRRYQEVWQQLLGAEQEAGQLLRKLASSLSDETLDDLFRSAESMGFSRHLVELLDYDWHARPGIGLALTMLAAAPGHGHALRWLKRLVG
jgi:digeranylgeranylglycerophospholipid reductase